MSADNNLGASSGAATLGAGTLHATASFPLASTRTLSITGAGTFQVDGSTTLTLNNGFANSSAAATANMNLNGGGTLSVKGNVSIVNYNTLTVNNATLEADHDLDLDNALIFQTRIEKPGWKKRWNTKPDLDIRPRRRNHSHRPIQPMMMPKPTTVLAAITLSAATQLASAHLIGDSAHDRQPVQYAQNVAPPTNVIRLRPQALNSAGTNRAAQIAAAFAPFAPRVKLRSDEKFFFVESEGLPAHDMMVGITAWQQQVPLPQPYFGDNAWRFPLAPVPAAQPRTIKNHFLRGAIAIAANGIPIFNPQNNRGDVSAEIGELDQWGGHCGRADDYHYHAAPLHLQSVVGKALPIAYALDGYAIYGLIEPDGSAPAGLDAINGHSIDALGYHYHASTKYPYVNGGFHGEVVEVGGQVDPQPRARSVREALQQMRGAKITGFTNSPDQKTFALKYSVNERAGGVNYSTTADGSWKFQFISPDGTTREETYSAPGGRRGGEGSPRNQGEGGPPEQPRRDRNRPPPERSDARQPREAANRTPPLIVTPKRSGNFVLTSPVMLSGGALPTEFTGDGAGSTLPLEWKGAPEGTKSFALVMDHLAPGNVMKCYWTMWDIPATVTTLPKNAKGIGKLGASFKGQVGYEPPHSQGPGLKTYTIHFYALSESPRLTQPAREVTREVLLTAIKDFILDSAELKATYTRPEGGN